MSENPNSESSSSGSLHTTGTDKPTALACIECRRKHVKCDARTPSCLRCIATRVQCRYQPSRRGRMRRNQFLSQPSQFSIDADSGNSLTLTGESGPSGTRFEPAQIVWNSTLPQLSPLCFENHVENREMDLGESGASTNQAEEIGQELPSTTKSIPARTDESFKDDELLVNLFYANFHVSHPFLVPRELYYSQNYPIYLKTIVHLIGCHFSGTECSETLEGAASTALCAAQNDGEENHTLVQSYLLFALALHARNNIHGSISATSQAVSMALNLGMHRQTFSSIHSFGSVILEESLRRTWWEVYIMDGAMAVIHHQTTFRCHSVQTDVLLPCDDSLYMEGAFMIEPATLLQFESRVYVEEPPQFSSFSYRIEAIQILGRVLAAACVTDIHPDQIQAIDSALAAWPHHLDLDKTEPTTVSGEIDEMLFQAHMWIQYAIMYLHFPRSDLLRSLQISSSIIPQQNLLPAYTRSMHGIKAIEASKRLSNLATMRSVVHNITPFFLNALFLGGLIYVSGGSLQASGYQQYFYDRVRLTTGILRTLSPVWALARDKRERLQGMILNSQAKFTNFKMVHPESLVDSAIDVSLSGTRLEMIQFPWTDSLR